MGDSVVRRNRELLDTGNRDFGLDYLYQHARSIAPAFEGEVLDKLGYDVLPHRVLFASLLFRSAASSESVLADKCELFINPDVSFRALICGTQVRRRIC